MRLETIALLYLIAGILGLLWRVGCDIKQFKQAALILIWHRAIRDKDERIFALYLDNTRLKKELEIKEASK